MFKEVYPYPLRKQALTRPNQVWSVGLIYIPVLRRFVYPAAVTDGYSRYLLDWQFSNMPEESIR